MRAARWLPCLIGCLVGCWLSATSARAADPDRQWQTLETEHFIISYPVPLEPVARRLGVVAERAHRVLVPVLRYRPEGKTLVVLHDDTDGANGFANVTPRNAITIFATAPSGASLLGDHDDWLYALFAHEYTHVLHLDTMSGLPRLYNALYGKIWAPNQLFPRWLIEGLATYEESKRSAGGRTRHTEADAVLRTQTLADRPVRLDQMTGAPRLYPGGNIAYLHGSSFLRYVFDRYGDDKAADMSHAGGAYPVPFALNRQLTESVGRSFEDVYQDWQRHLRDRYSLQELAIERRGLAAPRRLTDTGVLNWRPRYSADGKWLWWLHGDGLRPSKVRRMPIGGTLEQSQEVTKIEALGGFDLASDGALVYEQTRSYQDQYSVQDLFVRPASGAAATQLTRRRRARDPAVSPDGRWVAYSQNGESTSVLAIAPLVAAGESIARALPAPLPHPAVAAGDGEVVWRGQPFDQVYQPAWSPDGGRLAFSAWRRGGHRDILVLELGTGQVTEVTRDRAVDVDPEFSHDGRWLYFSSDRSGVANLFAHELATGELWQVTDELGGAYQPASSPDGKRLAFRGLGPDGSDLFELEVEPARWRAAQPYLDDRPAPTQIRDEEAVVSASRPYRALETLAPQTWSYELSSTAKGSYTTLRTSGSDAVGRHNYSLSTGVALPRAELNVAASYGYGGLAVPVRVSASRTTNERSGFRVAGKSLPYRDEVWSAALSMGMPGQRRTGTSWFLSFDLQADYARLVEKPDDSPDPNDPLPRAPLSGYLQTGLGVRLSYSSVEATLYGVGPQAGADASVALRLDLPELGATYRALTATYAARWFQQVPVGGWLPSLALRLSGAARVGELARAGGYSLGGVPVQDLVSAVIDSTRVSTVGSLRGYPVRTVVGNQFHLLAAELRQPLWRAERGLSTLPVYLQRVHVAVLGDAALAYDGEPSLEAVRPSLGAALRFDLFLGYAIGGTLELGVARGLGERGLTESWALLTGVL